MAGNTKEIITLQVGHYSNFVGAHWWNLQEGSFVYDEKKISEINHDILFREGKTLQGEDTYLPRAVIIDCKGSLHSLKQIGNLYDYYQNDNSSIDSVWGGNLTVHKGDSIKKNEFLLDLDKEDSLLASGEGINNAEAWEKDVCEASSSCEKNEILNNPSKTKFYNLDSSVQVWSDFLRMHLHPQSLYVIEDYFHDNESNAFDLFGLGIQTWANKKNSEEIEDRIRFYSEECDYLQAFHIILDGNNGFSGLGTEISSHLQDEFPKKNVISFPVFPALCKNNQQVDHSVNCLWNTAFTLEKFSTLTSMTLPLSLASTFDNCFSHPTREFPYLIYDASLSYHSSAVLAAGLDTLTMPYRLKQNQFFLQDIIDNTTISGMKIVASCLGLPLPLSQDNLDKPFHHLNEETHLMNSLTPGINFPEKNILRQTFVLRGLNNTNDFDMGNTNVESSYSYYSSIERTFTQYLNRIIPSSYSTIKIINEPCNTIAPYPNLFPALLSSDGYISSKSRAEGIGVKTVPAVAGIMCNLKVGEMLQKLCNALKKKSALLNSSISRSGLEVDELKDTLENLWDFSLNYEIS